LRSIVIGGGAAGLALILALSVWHWMHVSRLRSDQALAETAAASELRRCLDQNLGKDMAPRGWRIIQLACERVTAGEAASEAECVLRSRDAVLNEATTDPALTACGFAPD
jgi:hypothetical protein